MGGMGRGTAATSEQAATDAPAAAPHSEPLATTSKQAATDAPAAAPISEPTVGGLPASLVAAAQALPGRRVCVVGGRTGVGKTRVLRALRRMGAHVIDLEGLAQHRGSAFGWVGQQWQGKAPSDAPDQPTTEHFGNLLALEWREVNRKSPAATAAAAEATDAAYGAGTSAAASTNAEDGAATSAAGRAAAVDCLRPSASEASSSRGWVFLEDEDTHIGGVTLPAGLYAMLRCAPLVVRVHVGEVVRLGSKPPLTALPSLPYPTHSTAAVSESSCGSVCGHLGFRSC